VIDDVPSARWNIKLLLNNLGFTGIEEAKGGNDALAKLRSATFHLVLSDWNMSDMDGLALFESMQASPRLRRIPFVMITGSVKPEKMEAVASSGIHALITKPVNEDSLRNAIVTAITKIAKSTDT
jgi:two-component system, chemotaxis family, chemotaxis protein CheY